MRAVVCHQGDLTVEDLPDLRPGPGHLLLDVAACGICGSDLHARHSADELADEVAGAGYPTFMRTEQRVVMGHEFSGTVVETGRGVSSRLIGKPMVAMPMVRQDGAVRLTGLDAGAPGGYADQVLVQSALAFEVPNGLSPEVASLTEPMAVALHAVRRSQIGKGQVAIVIGCGPIGLGVIAMLKASGVRTVVASDFSPTRRELATGMGADVVVDPAVGSPWEVPSKRFIDTPGLLNLAVDSMSKLRAVPFLPWQHVMAAADKVGAVPKGPVVFECVGVPGMIGQVMAAAPLQSRVVVVGVCMQPDTIRPATGINKEIDLRFVFGYLPTEFHQTLHWLAEGKVDPRPLVTGLVGLDGVAGAFEALGDPEAHAKILVTPGREGSEVAAPPAGGM